MPPISFVRVVQFRTFLEPQLIFLASRKVKRYVAFRINFLGLPVPRQRDVFVRADVNARNILRHL